MNRPPRRSQPARPAPRAVTALVAAAVAVALPLATAGGAAGATTDADLQRGLERLVGASGGPPGAVMTLHRDGRTTVLRAGRANVRRPGAPRAGDHMRIASVSKAYSGAVALRLVQDGRLGLDDTIGQRLPSLPAAWHAVTIRQLLNHTSGLPDYTRSDGFIAQAQGDPRGFVAPEAIVGWVRSDGLAFAPGSRYAYSNTDNIVVGLIAEAITGRPYGTLLDEIVFGPGRLRQTTFPTRVALPAPFIHGYVVGDGPRPTDVSTFLSPSGAWASGAIVATPSDLARFIRLDLGRAFFGAEQQREQLRFVPGSSSPAGPGANAAGLALFRYTTRCGVVYGHTGNFPGYVQWAAATADGRRSVTTSLNIPAPTGALLRQLRTLQSAAVCALLGRPAATAAAARPTAQRLDARLRTRLDRALDSSLARTWAPGAIAGVWVGGRGWTAVRGVADRTTGRLARLNDHTRIGSVTKTFTGTLILQLVDEGKLRLDDTIERWFPSVPDASRITIRDLGDMSSGIASYVRDAPLVSRYLADPRQPWTVGELIADGLALPRVFAPGDGFDYSNTNLLMLGQIVEQVTGRPLAEVMRTKLFAPLGMRHTTYAPAMKLPSPSWRGYTLQGSTDGTVLDATGWNPTFTGAAGQIVSTLGDLRVWTRAVGSGSLLKPATQRARLQPNRASARAGRAYAFAIGTAGGWLLHSGEVPGFNTQIAYLPARRTAIVVLANADLPGPTGNPAPTIFNALAGAVAPGTLPAAG